jgi:N-acetylneuraminate synthase
MCGGSAEERRRLSQREIEYLDALVRGVYAVRDLPAGHALTDEDYYLAVPLQKGQLSCRELITNDLLVQPVRAHQAITIDMLDNPYSRVPELRQTIMERGL